jgi:acyl-coenzyme A synthetase/AMP-(fatty) acid ligase
MLVDIPATSLPEQVAIVSGSSRVTFAALADLTNRIGHVLRDLGCAPGDRVLVAVPDSPESIAALLAIVKTGALAARRSACRRPIASCRRRVSSSLSGSASA